MNNETAPKTTRTTEGHFELLLDIDGRPDRLKAVLQGLNAVLKSFRTKGDVEHYTLCLDRAGDNSDAAFKIEDELLNSGEKGETLC